MFHLIGSISQHRGINIDTGKIRGSIRLGQVIVGGPLDLERFQQVARRQQLFVRPGKQSHVPRSEEHTSELQSLMRISYAVFCLKKKNIHMTEPQLTHTTTTKKRHKIRY